MQRNIFSPKVKGGTTDLSVFFQKTAEWILIVVLGLLPIFFIPGVYTTIGFMKVYWVVLGVFATLVISCLALLRGGKIELTFPLAIFAFAIFSLMGVASALLSGDVADSLIGTNFDVYTAGFLVLLTSVMLSCLVFIRAKAAFVRLLMVFSAATFLVYLFSLGRFLFGANFLSLGIFNSNLVSPLGSLNDLALFAGLILLMILLTAHKVGANWFMKAAFSFFTLGSLLILAVVNFSFVWLAVGFFALLSFLYLIAKDTWFGGANLEERTVPRFALVLVAVVCLVSGSFLVSGSYLGAKVASVTGISYLEVRPSLEATLDIARSVYRENALFGIGPNRFEDAWRLYKDPVINETQFWNTTFAGANSFASTMFITIGLSGLITFFLFLAALLYTGYRMFFVTKFLDGGWRIVGIITFASTVYLWAMSFIYTPGASIMLLAAVMTGLMVAVGISSSARRGLTIDVIQSKQHGFILVGVVLLLIVGATATFISVNQRFLAQADFLSAGVTFAATLDVPQYDQALAEASELVPDQDEYLAERARLRLAELNRLLGVSEPTEDEQKRFQAALLEGIQLAEQTTVIDSSNPFNHALLGSFYGLINPSLYEGALERRQASFGRARALDPYNPEYWTLEAQIGARFGEVDSARKYLTEAIALKSNYTDALFLLSQLDIQQGDAAAAIITTQSIVALEPNNPARHFQLGLLQAAIGDNEAAVVSFERAIALDPSYANARYMLAMSYLDRGQAEAALEQLRIVLVDNADNQGLVDLIAQVEQGTYTNPPLGFETPVRDSSPTETQDDVTISTELPETDLVSPMNQIPSTPDSEL